MRNLMQVLIQLIALPQFHLHPPSIIDSSTQSNFVNSDMPCTTPTPNVRKRKLKSEVWKYFNKTEKIKLDGTKYIKVVCIACGDELAGAPTMGKTDISNFQQLGRDKDLNLSTFTYTDANARQDIIDYMIRAEQPFTFVEKHDLTGMIQPSLNPLYKGFCHLGIQLSGKFSL